MLEFTLGGVETEFGDLEGGKVAATFGVGGKARNLPLGAYFIAGIAHERLGYQNFAIPEFDRHLELFTASLGGRLYVMLAERVRLFGDLSFGWEFEEADIYFSDSTRFVNVGIGASVHLSPSLALLLRLDQTETEFEDRRASANLGISLHF